MDVELERDSVEPSCSLSATTTLRKSASTSTLIGMTTHGHSHTIVHGPVSDVPDNINIKLEKVPTSSTPRSTPRKRGKRGGRGTPAKTSTPANSTPRDFSMMSDDDSRASFSSAGASEISALMSGLPSGGLMTPTKTKVGMTGWTHLQIKSEPSSPIPRVMSTTPTRSSLVSEDSNSSHSVDRAILMGTGSLSGRSENTTPVPIKIEPMSPDRVSLNRTPVKHLGEMGGITVTPAATPTKNGTSSGWTHVQIKSEPTSPVQIVPTGMSGWQRISNLTTPPKSNRPVSPASSKGSLSSPVGIKPVTLQIGSIGSKTGNSTSSSEATTPETPQDGTAKTPIINIGGTTTTGEVLHSRTIGGSSIVMGGQSLGQTLTSPLRLGQGGMDVKKASPGLVRTAEGGMLLIQPGGPANRPQLAPPIGMPAPRPGQPTVYVKCVDNQGKIYLIPQHLLTKVPTPAGSPVVSPARQLTPGQVIIGQQSLLNPQKVNPRIPAPHLVQTSPGQGTIIRMPSTLGGTTAGAPQLILQASPAPAGQKVAVSVGSNVVLQMAAQAGVSPMITAQTGAKISTQVSKAGPQTSTPTSSTPNTPVLKTASRPNTPAPAQLIQLSTSDPKNIQLEGRSPMVSPIQSPARPTGQNLPENFMLLGGNLVATPNKTSMLVVNQEASQASRVGAVSLLSGKFSGASGGKVMTSQVPISAGAVVQQKGVVGITSTVSGAGRTAKAQVILLQGATSKPQSILTQTTSKASLTTPQSLLTGTKPVTSTKGQVSVGQSLLTTATIGNQTVILQLLPEQQSSAKAAANQTIVSTTNGISSATKITQPGSNQKTEEKVNVNVLLAKMTAGKSVTSRPRPLGTCDTLRPPSKPTKSRRHRNIW